MSINIKRLPDAELEVMNALWGAGRPLTRAELQQLLAAKEWASTTLLALLSRLEEKGFVARQKQGRGYLYTAAVSRQDYLPVESRSLLGRMFGGSAKSLVAALVETDALSPQDIRELSDYLQQLKQQNSSD